MHNAESVTFGGSALDRAAPLRAMATDIAAQAGAETILLWRGRPLIAGADCLRLVRFPFDHPLLADVVEAPLFLGRIDGTPLFAHDLSAWQPEGANITVSERPFDSARQCHPLLPLDHGFCDLRAVLAQLLPQEGELAATAKALFGWHQSHCFCSACASPSKIGMAGWQRNCPECGTQHFPRTDPVVIMLVTRGNSVLLGRSPGWNTGMYSLLAGFVEPGETMEAAVRREVFEESGIHVGPVRYLASQPWPFPASLMMGCHGIAQNERITIDPVEIEDARWFTREEVAEAFAGQHPFLLPSRKGAIAHFILHGWLADRLE